MHRHNFSVATTHAMRHKVIRALYALFNEFLYVTDETKMTSEQFINGAYCWISASLYFLDYDDIFASAKLQCVSGTRWNCEGILSGNKFRSKYIRNIYNPLITEYTLPFCLESNCDLKKRTQPPCHHETVKRETTTRAFRFNLFSLLRHLSRHDSAHRRI